MGSPIIFIISGGDLSLNIYSRMGLSENREFGKPNGVPSNFMEHLNSEKSGSIKIQWFITIFPINIAISSGTNSLDPNGSSGCHGRHGRLVLQR